MIKVWPSPGAQIKFLGTVKRMKLARRRSLVIASLLTTSICSSGRVYALSCPSAVNIACISRSTLPIFSWKIFLQAEHEQSRSYASTTKRKVEEEEEEEGESDEGEDEEKDEIGEEDEDFQPEMDKFVIRTKRKREEGEEKEEPAWPSPPGSKSVPAKKLAAIPAKPPAKKGRAGAGGAEKVVIRRTQGTRKTTELTLEKHPNYNEQLTTILQELGNLEKSKGQMHRSRAYFKAVKALQAYPKKITSGKEAQELEGIGAKIGAKIDEILASGQLNKLNQYQSDPELMALNLMQQVSGIGPAAAKKFVHEYGIRSLEDLEKHKHLLNHHQLIGLKYFHELNTKIPRSEMQLLEAYVKGVINEVDPNIIATTCGSYRRGAPRSSDIDLLITHPKYTNATKDMTPYQYLPRIVEALHKRGFLTDDISHGKTKYMGVCLLKDGPPGIPLAEKKEQEDKEEEADNTTEKKGKEKQKVKESDEENEEEEEETKEKKDDSGLKAGVPFHRRIDLRMIPYENYYCGLLYFTGSDFFNQQMRTIALEKGFTLNEYSIRPVGETGEVGEPLEVHSEKDVFDYISMEYKSPEERSL